MTTNLNPSDRARTARLMLDEVMADPKELIPEDSIILSAEEAEKVRRALNDACHKNGPKYNWPMMWHEALMIFERGTK